ncbi:MAG: ATP-binding protein, partial [Candidatus Latescibacteria bacterium]|nr:ATP-binding protein [Candidatus Latescibacterota bacterium]
VADDVGEVNTDEDKLRHALGNLLSNAVKFTDEGEIGVRVRMAQDQLVISVLDTGVGMPQESLATIFDEFQQVKGSTPGSKGTGLGLAIVKQYTELLGGRVSVESEVGRGTTFTLRMPMVYKAEDV